MATRLFAATRFAIYCLTLTVLIAGNAAFGQTFSPNIPNDVSSPGSSAINTFDTFSWESFVALNWPSLATNRGQPDTAKKFGDMSSPPVWLTYKADWETVQQSPNPQWSSFDLSPGMTSPCTGVTEKDLVLASFNHWENMNMAGVNGSLSSPLVDQLGNYVTYQTKVNQIEFDAIFQNQLYLQQNLQSFNTNAKPVTFPLNAIELKAAWRIMDNVPAAQQLRYFTTKAYLMDINGNCAQHTVGLIGLHIVQKTLHQPQWIWSTFEQIDNVPSIDNQPPPPTGIPYSLNKPAAPQQLAATQPIVGVPGGFPPRVPPSSNPQPMQDLRQQHIHPATLATNKLWMSAIAQQAPQSPWQYYQLVMTQWPTNPSDVPDFGVPFPSSQLGPDLPNNQFSNTANVSMEMFEQATDKQLTCMDCHGPTSVPKDGIMTDFVWFLNVQAVPSATAAKMFLPRIRAREVVLPDGLHGTIDR